MNHPGSPTMSARSSRPLRHLLAAALTALGLCLVVAACGGGGTIPAPGVQVRPLPADMASRKAVAYGPYRTATSDADRANETITEAMVKEDMDILLAGGFRLIRLFNSSDKEAKLILETIQKYQLDMKVMLGIWIASESGPGLSASQIAANKAANEAEVKRGVALANDPRFKNIVATVSVGNETMVFWTTYPTSPAIMADYIQRVRDQITQPVTTDDDRAFYTQAPSNVLDLIDFAAVHVYPLSETIPPATSTWDWQQQSVPEDKRAVAMMDAAIEAANKHYVDVRSHLDSRGRGAVPILITETGWKTEPNKGEFGRAHPVNHKMYYDRLVDWVNKAKNPSGPLSFVYFEAFNEPWKQSDDKWGLFSVERKAYYVVKDLYPSSMWVPGTSTLTDADAVYPPTVSNDTITANRYTLYADAVTPGEFRVTGLQFFGWDSPPNAFAGEFTGSASDGEAFHYMEVGPSPAAYGWGLFATYSASTDLSLFEATGRLNFRIKTTYPGKLRFGFLTGSGSTGYDVFLTVSNTNADGYGFVSDGQWHDVSIPVSALKAAGAPSFGNSPTNAKFDLTKVTNPFVVNDVYDITGNTGIKGNKTPIFIDNIHWTK